MKKTVFIWFAVAVNVCYAQEDQAVTEKLKQHYSEVVYHHDHGGWYTIRMGEQNCKTCVGACDKLGYEMIPCIYDDVVGFVSAGYFQVKRNNKFYAVPLSEKKLLIQADAGFSDFARKYVEPKINEWQMRGEFEPTAAWQQRVNEITRKEQIAKFAKEAEELFIAQHMPDLKINLSLGQYDADNETFLITDNYSDKNMLVHVSVSKAPYFKDSWAQIHCTPQYGIENDGIAIAGIDFRLPNGETYNYSDQTSLHYTVTQADYNFEPIDFNLGFYSQTAYRNQQSISAANVLAGKSDVAVNIPVTSVKNDYTFAVIIANENYRRESKVEFAQNDGETFRKYCTQTLGMPEINVHFTTDATLNDIRVEIDWLSNVAEAFNGEANIIFYYAGHGIPDENSKSACLLPVDGFGTNVNSAYKLDDLYQTLGEMPAKTVIAFIDACFSGTHRSGDMMTSARGVAIKIDPGAPAGNTVVFSAAQGAETAYSYREKGHGMFTYFLLKKLQETNGEVTLGELDDYIAGNVRRQSIIVNKKNQTPVVTPSATLGADWRNRKLK